MSGASDLVAAVGGLFRVDWNRHSAKQWQTMLDHCARPALTQSPSYASALAEAEGARADYGLIRFHNKPIGMAIVTRRRGFAGAGQHSLYRGPAWIYDDMPGHMLRLGLGELRQRYRWWRGRPLTFHPELADTADNRRTLAAAGYRRVAEGYATIWLDLALGLDTLRANLKSEWRNQLAQAERNDLDVVGGDSDARFEWLCEAHEQHMAVHGYRGPSPELLRALRAHAAAGQEPVLLIGERAGEPVAAALFARHGNAATYLVGWTGEEGRRLRAQNLVLWRGIEHLKAARVRWLDLGGVSAEAPGLAHFKQGLGGEAVTLVGGYV